MTDLDRAHEFIVKSSKWLDWCDLYYQNILEYGKSGNIDDVERTFVTVLLLLDAIHQSLADAAKKLGATSWRDDLNKLRETDPLLRYVWNARRSEAHDALVKWRPDMKYMEFKVVLPETARILQFGAPNDYVATQRLIFKAFGVSTQDEFFDKAKAGHSPLRHDQLAAGIEFKFSLDTLSLDSFTIGSGNRAESIPAPEQHLGKMLPPSATEATRLAIEFYRNRARELEAFSP